MAGRRTRTTPRGGVGWIVALCAVALAACDASDGSGTDAPERWCQGVCDAKERCEIVAPENSCVDACVRDRPGLARISVPAAALLGPCMAKLPCQAFGDDTAWNAHGDACWEQAKAALGSSEHVRAFCSAYSRAWFQCGSWFATAECERNFSMWADEVIAEADQCMSEKTCEQFDACTSAVFEE